LQVTKKKTYKDTSCKKIVKYGFEIETVTPLFVGGSNPQQPEIRAASFRGALRFWLRALLGGVLGDRPDKIFQYESQVFGSTDYASPVVVRLEPHNLGSDSFNPLPHKQVKFRFNGFKPGQRFDICLLSRDEDALQQAQKALLLLCYLGGLGRRSRRGFGSLQITDGKLALTAKTAKELSNALKQRLDAILPSSPSFANLSKVPRFPILHPDWAQIKVCTQEFDSDSELEGWKKAIKFVMEKAHKHKNPVLGNATPRQASPVHVHVTRLSTGKYALVLTTMLSQLNPKLPGADPQKLVDFLNDFKGDVIFGKEVPKNWLGGSVK
jgi:CRISPR-associated protein Cmr1